MSSHESRESRFDEPLEPDRLIPPGGASPDADAVSNNLDPGGPDGNGDLVDGDADPVEVAEVPAEAEADRWDANDPRRKNDSFAPPMEPCECHCLHCGRTFSSEGIWFQKVINDPQGFDGFWMCPTPNCSGAGFTFDIFPTDPDHPANEGWIDDEDEDDVAGAYIEDIEVDDDDEAGGWSATGLAGDDEADEYDPAEPHYQQMDDFYGDEDDDLEGEEWKHGLQPGERPPEPAWREEARREWEEDQKMYDEPDQRPRVLDWSNREDRKEGPQYGPMDGKFSDDDIPF